MKSSLSIVRLSIPLLCLVMAVAHAQNAPVVVSASKPTTVTNAEPRSYVATILPAETVHITAKVNGSLWNSNFKEGSIVKKGDLLFEIEDTVYRANLQAAQATLKRIEAEFDYAQKEYERNKQLAEKKVISDSEFATYVKDRDTLAAQLLEAKASITLCENNLSYTKIHAPMTGRIGRRMISVGNEITPQSGELATIVQFDPVKIRFAISEADYYQKLPGGERVNYSIAVKDAAGHEIKDGITLDFIDNQVDAGTDTIMLQFLCPNPANDIVPGGYARIEWTEHFVTPKLAVPKPAVMTKNGNSFVYVVKQDNTVELRPIMIGEQVFDLQIVDSGLTEQDLVITAGTHKIIPGGSVTVSQSQEEANR